MLGTITMEISYLQSMISGSILWVRLICKCDLYAKIYSNINARMNLYCQHKYIRHHKRGRHCNDYYLPFCDEFKYKVYHTIKNIKIVLLEASSSKFESFDWTSNGEHRGGHNVSQMLNKLHPDALWCILVLAIYEFPIRNLCKFIPYSFV